MKKILSLALSIVMVFSAAFAVPASAEAASVARVKSVRVIKKGTNSVKLKWKRVRRATGYQVYCSTRKNKGYKRVKTVKKGKTVKATVKNLKSGKRYYFKVRAVRGKRKGRFSKRVSAKTNKYSYTPSYTGECQSTYMAFELEDGETYSLYDVTGNGAPDDIKCIYGNVDGLPTVNIYVNGVKTPAEIYDNYSKKNINVNECSPKGFKAGLYAPTADNCYIIIRFYAVHGYNRDYFFKYKNGKFTEVRSDGMLQEREYMDQIGTYIRDYDDTFTAIGTVGYDSRDLLSSETKYPLEFKFNFKFEDNKIKLSSLYGDAVQTTSYTVNKTFHACKSPLSTSTSYTVNEGCTLTVLQAYMKYSEYDGQGSYYAVFKAEVLNEYGDTFTCWIDPYNTGVEMDYDSPLLVD